MPVPTFPGGALVPGSRQPAEPVLGDLHQPLGRGAFWSHRSFSPQGVFLPGMEGAFQWCGEQGTALLIRWVAVNANTRLLEEGGGVIETQLVLLLTTETVGHQALFLLHNAAL